MGPEQEKLTERLFGNPARKPVNFKFTLGDNPGSSENVCAEINKAMDELGRFRALPVEEQMRIQMAQVYERLSIAIEHCKFNVADWDKPVEDARKRLSAIFGELDMSMLTIGNWIDHPQRMAIKARSKIKVS